MDIGAKRENVREGKWVNKDYDDVDIGFMSSLPFSVKAKNILAVFSQIIALVRFVTCTKPHTVDVV